MLRTTVYNTELANSRTVAIVSEIFVRCHPFKPVSCRISKLANHVVSPCDVITLCSEQHFEFILFTFTEDDLFGKPVFVYSLSFFGTRV